MVLRNDAPNVTFFHVRVASPFHLKEQGLPDVQTSPGPGDSGVMADLARGMTKQRRKSTGVIVAARGCLYMLPTLIVFGSARRRNCLGGGRETQDARKSVCICSVVPRSSSASIDIEDDAPPSQPRTGESSAWLRRRSGQVHGQLRVVL
jgi:hypothetical protein